MLACDSECPSNGSISTEVQLNLRFSELIKKAGIWKRTITPQRLNVSDLNYSRTRGFAKAQLGLNSKSLGYNVLFHSKFL